jgi:hypothetical protein
VKQSVRDGIIPVYKIKSHHYPVAAPLVPTAMKTQISFSK